MTTETKRVPTNYAVSRAQKRYIAKQNIKKANVSAHPFKHDYTTVKKGNFTTYTRNGSYFSEHWREYVEADE
jgi:hypothetical protein